MTNRIQAASAVAIVSGLLLLAESCFGLAWADKGDDAAYDPRIDPAEFSTNITNKYFRLRPGTKFTYLNRSVLSTERVEIEVTGETKVVMGVTTLVIRAREWVNDVIKEDTRDWYAQDKAGNVWYFGEAVDNYKDGKIANHNGTWEAGVNGAKPGIAMFADPKVGESYRQEYAKGNAEDMGTVVSLNEKVVVPHGTYDGCLKIRDWSVIDKSANEHKYYCPQVGFLTMEETIGLIKSRTELVGVTVK